MNLKLILAPLFVLGIADSAYLLYEHYLLYTLPYCPVNSCLPPNMPFPSFILPFFGLIWFLAGLFLLYVRSNKIILKIWQISGVLGVIFLFGYSILIGYFCPYCYLAHATGLILVGLSFRMGIPEERAKSR
ncbi:MAG: hypothetical protein NZ879_05460 [Archaeoglobaceae archaeon]|nr:hypothetical protein [Archaeoglobaceae archaeon]MDW8118413.1 hypothetical protein [Archaeoglobaceae archaeon]